MKVTREDLDELAFRFFRLFAQYEFTMKEKSCFKVKNKSIEADWNRFANEVVGSKFWQELIDKGIEVEYILNCPPKRQGINEQNKICWIEVSNKEKNVQALFGHISRVRNNLFHGAKFNTTWFDPCRSEKLLAIALEILEYYKQRLDDSNLSTS